MADKKDKPDEKPVVIGKLPSSLWWVVIIICIAVFFQKAYIIHKARAATEGTLQQNQQKPLTGTLRLERGKDKQPGILSVVIVKRTRSELLVNYKAPDGCRGKLVGSSADGIIYEGRWQDETGKRQWGNFQLSFNSPNEAIGWQDEASEGNRTRIPTSLQIG